MVNPPTNISACALNSGCCTLSFQRTPTSESFSLDGANLFELFSIAGAVMARMTKTISRYCVEELGGKG